MIPRAWIVSLLLLAACGDGAAPAMPAATLLFEAPQVVGTVTTDADFIYWVDGVQGNTDTAIGRVMRLARSGGAVEVVAERRESPNQLLVGASALYWTEGDPFYACRSIVMLPTAGGEIADLTPPRPICAHGTIAEHEGLLLLLADEDVGGSLESIILAVDPTGAHAPTVRTRLGTVFVTDVVVAGATIYLLREDGDVLAAPLDGSTGVSTPFRDLGRATRFAVDSDELYWVDEHVGGGSDLLHESLGGARERLARLEEKVLGGPFVDGDKVWLLVASGPAEAPSAAFLRLPARGPDGELERFEAPYQAQLHRLDPVVDDGDRFLVMTEPGPEGLTRVLAQPRP